MRNFLARGHCATRPLSLGTDLYISSSDKNTESGRTVSPQEQTYDACAMFRSKLRIASADTEDVTREETEDAVQIALLTLDIGVSFNEPYTTIRLSWLARHKG